MGWSNYIIIPKMKLAIEVSRSVEELDCFKVRAIKKAMDFCTTFDFDVCEILEKKYKNLTLADLNVMMNGLKILKDFQDMCAGDLFLYYLEEEDIDYKVVSEHEFEKKKLEGYTIIRHGDLR